MNSLPLTPLAGGIRTAPERQTLGSADSFQIPKAAPSPLQEQSLPVPVQDTLSLGSLESELDQIVQSFLEDMEKKTGLGPEVLMAGLNQSFQRLPDLEKMLQTFSNHVQSAGNKQGVAISLPEIQGDLRTFLKEVQATLQENAKIQTPSDTAGAEKSYQFEVINSDQARDRRSQEIVERIQKQFFSPQSIRPESISRNEGLELPGSDRFAKLLTAQHEFHSTNDFFKVREQENQLLARLNQIGAHTRPAVEPLLVSAVAGSTEVKPRFMEDSTEFSDSLLDQIVVSSPPTSGQVGSLVKGSSFQEALKVQMPADVAVENLGEIIQSARVAAKAGGGDMEMELKPEGLGRVQVKVSVEGDQVQVQMIAENKKVQDMLQEGLQDLRAQLASQKLHSESLTVGSSSQSQNAELTGRESGQERSFAQGFMHQFREEREAARGGMTRFPAPEGRSSGRSTDVIQPLNIRPRAHEGRLSLIA